MAKKPKAWRGYQTGGAAAPEVWVLNSRSPDRPNCTVIPDGATVPLPASVRRVMRYIPDIKSALLCEAAHHFADCRDAPDPRCPTCMALKAVKAYERAVAKGRKR